MAVDSKHPWYDKLLGRWIIMQDCYDGEEAIKLKGTTYLPATSGQIEDGQATGNKNSLGQLAYEAYKVRALFPSVVEDAVEALLGIMHRKPADIQVPKAMEPMLESATINNESMQLLLRKINEQQLVTGRVGLMVDLSAEENTGDNGPILPHIALYKANTIINWDDGSRTNPVLQTLNLVVLEESEAVRVKEYEWEAREKYRVLFLGKLEENEDTGRYRVKLVNKNASGDNDDGEAPEEEIRPNLRGKELDEIPFVFINSKDLVPKPDTPPLMGLGYLALAIYRGEADHRQGLFMQAQDTLVVEGGDDEKQYRTGANATIVVDIGGDAKFIGVDSTGLSEMRHNLENDKKIAAHKAAQMTDTTSRQRESGDALRVRVAAQTASINHMADAGAEGLQTVLRIVGRWMGMEEKEIKKITVEANKDFSADNLEGKTLKEYMEAKILGAPITMQDLHELIKKRGLTSLTFEEATAILIKEAEEAEAKEIAGPGTEDGGSGEDGQ